MARSARFYLLGILFFSFAACQNKASIPHHRKISFDSHWHFHLGDLPNAESTSFNDSSWRLLNLPHDWSIEGKFDKNNPAGVGGGALPGGIGWYRKTFTVPVKDSALLKFIDFDGVYENSKVWINGHYLGNRPYGYSSFRYELTPYLHYGNQKNVIAVRVDNSRQPNSRWYSGSGIYRNVWLVTTDKVHVGHWGTYVTTPKVSKEQAEVSIKTTVKNNFNNAGKVQLITRILDSSGNKVAQTQSEQNIAAGSSWTFSQNLSLDHPELWSVQRPMVYTAVSEIRYNGQTTDQYKTDFGIRRFHFDPQKGFFLNGKHLKIKGVCDHHDLGSLGAAVNTRAIQRQLELLKGMGANAIRTSHNPPAPELLQLCDQMGFLVMDEAFDCWKTGKNKYDYHIYWDQWHKKDLSDMIRRDRNHPSIIIWSIGNEIPDQWDTAGATIARALSGIVRSLDTTRPITSAMNNPPYNKDNYIAHSGALDLIGFNYHQYLYPEFPKKFKGGKMIATETTSALESRGIYDMPSDSIRVWPTKESEGKMDSDFMVSAYDNVHVPWGATHETLLKDLKKYDFLSGTFVWTGFDYLGEPTPYGWPARSSYFGIIDLAGFPKDAYYLYQSVWSDSTVLHLLPPWDPNPRKYGWSVGDSVDVWAYYNHADKVTLYLNGKSLGSRSKQGNDLHVMWRVPFEPGTLKAVSYKNGKEVKTVIHKTAHQPNRLSLAADRSTIKANGKDLSFITIKVEDQNGIEVPYADNLIHFDVTGPGFIAGVDNGKETDHEPFKADYQKAFNGQCLVIIQSKKKQGTVKLTAKADGLTSNTIAIKTE